VITDAIVPVGGLGTRLLPATRSQPKEMLPVVDKPVVQYVVEELAAAGIKRILFVTGRHKRAIEDHFDHPEVALKVLYTRQPSPEGLGDAIRCADGFANDGAVVALGDAIIDPPGIVPKLVEAFESSRADATLGVQEVTEEDVSRRGIVVPADGNAVAEEAFVVSDLIEKPDPADVASRVALVGRFVLGRAVFAALRDTPPDGSGEVQLTDALRAVAAAGGRVLAVPLASGQRRHDIGSSEGYCATFIEYALRDPRFGKSLRARVRDG
jgi:UTP--glucose-1-phosphate uridylyltransferase